MKLAPARQAAFGALMAVERGAWSAEALGTKSLHLDARDAGLASDIVFGTLRHRGELDFLMTRFSNRAVDNVDTEVRIAIEMALYQMRFLDRIPAHAAVNDAVELVRRAGKDRSAAFVNAVLRQSQREQAEGREAEVSFFTESTPKWLLERWTAHYGEAVAMGIARASLEVPGRYIRVGDGIPPEGAVATEVPGCYRLDSGDPNQYRFQDIGSQAVVPLLELEAGQTLLDVCASPGNKTAQAMEAGVNAIACDVHFSRARILLALGIPVVTADASQPLPFAVKFDRVLVDAPCSGTGTLGRNPEIKWRLKADDIFDLRRRQKAILKNALGMVKPGGICVYSTCSMEREENEDVVAAVCAGGGVEVVRTLQRIPGRDAGDGFFAAALQV